MYKMRWGKQYFDDVSSCAVSEPKKIMSANSLWLFIMTDLNDKSPLGTAHIQTTEK